MIAAARSGEARLHALARIAAPLERRMSALCQNEKLGSNQIPEFRAGRPTVLNDPNRIYDARAAEQLLAVEQGATLQVLMSEAFDDLMRKFDKHLFGD